MNAIEQVNAVEHDEYVDLVFPYMIEDLANAVDGVNIAALEGLDYHIDKARQYKEEWEQAGLSFNRASLIYLLTFMRVFIQDTPKHESCQWVINNYKTYLPFLERGEAIHILEE
ncbi:hypothetical protein RVBP21_2280 [Pseudomonas phage BRkr]|nr:hypothetical protein RVBP21_2280 [Pseudomonas phage BRkr]